MFLPILLLVLNHFRLLSRMGPDPVIVPGIVKLFPMSLSRSCFSLAQIGPRYPSRAPRCNHCNLAIIHCEVPNVVYYFSDFVQYTLKYRRFDRLRDLEVMTRRIVLMNYLGCAWSPLIISYIVHHLTFKLDH